MSTERDELAEMRGELAELAADAAERDDDDWMTEAADAILAAGYRKPRTITTTEELDTLPVDSVIVDYRGSAYQWGIGLDGSEGWASTRDSNPITTNHLLRFQPLTVLHEGSRA